MLEIIESVNGAVNRFIWGVPAMVCTALAATVGTGNIAGVAGAIAMGGPGAVLHFQLLLAGAYMVQDV